ncbi:anti-sigma factor family protein (plasmid) [Sphingomonas panni]
MTIDPETLAAYADGELDPISAKRVERAMADDPSLAAEVERHRALTARLRGGFAGLDKQPMPAGVEALFARTDNVVAFPTRKPAPKPQRWWGAIAASLVAGLLLGQLVPRSGGDLGFEGGTAVAQGSSPARSTRSLPRRRGRTRRSGSASPSATAPARCAAPSRPAPPAASPVPAMAAHGGCRRCRAVRRRPPPPMPKPDRRWPPCWNRRRQWRRATRWTPRARRRR